MEWINVKESLPKPFEVVWIYWRDREVLLGCKTSEDSEPEENWYSFDDDRCRFTNWWQKVTASNYDKPSPPKFSISNQPERSKREDSKEMRCSEHCRNAVSDVQ